MAGRKILFIEGEPETASGNLRQGFEKLFAQKLKGKLPQIKLSGGKKVAVDRFLNNNFEGVHFLLVDLDAPEDRRKDDLRKNGLSKFSSDVFYMIQEMESWFISQPDVLNNYYGITATGKKVSEVMTKRKSAEIPNPKEELKRITQTLNKGEKYHEIKHAVELLELLDATQLENDFPDFKRLIEKLK